MSINPAAVKIMGILNATPDSFYAPSRTGINSRGRELIAAMIHDGADIIDVGGESTRPGSEYVSASEEIDRIIPLITYIRTFSPIPISVDTRKSVVAKEALSAGADIINDISAFEDDGEMSVLVKKVSCDAVLMHKKGTPQNMQKNPSYKDVVEEVFLYLENRIKFALSKGIKKEHLIIDPGFGFGKRHEDNIALLRNLNKFKELGCRILIGISRKSLIGNILNNTVDQRLNGTIIANAIGVFSGADIIRVHDVAEHVEMRKIFKAVYERGVGRGAS